MKFEEGNIYFTKIYIIQSIPDEERKTGTEIHDDLISRKAWIIENLTTELVDVNSKDEFIDLLQRIEQKVKSKHELPFLHFETHGSKEGILFKSNERLAWKEFIEQIRKINIYSGNNLYISVGACWGGRIQFELELTKPCPFRGFIGPMNELYPEDILISFTHFFDKLLTTNDFSKAIDQLNLYNDSDVEFHHTNSESFFDLVIDNFNKSNMSDPAKRKDRIRDLVKQFWSKDSKVREKYKTKGRFIKEVKKIVEKEMPMIYQRMRANFLHMN